MKPSKTNAVATARPYEFKQTLFQNPVSLHGQLRPESADRARQDRSPSQLRVFEIFPRLAVGVRCVDFEIIAENRRAFWQVAQQIRRRLKLLASLPFEKLDALRLEAATKEIGMREKIQIGNQAPA